MNTCIIRSHKSRSDRLYSCIEKPHTLSDINSHKSSPWAHTKPPTWSVSTCMVIKFKTKQMSAQESLKVKLSHCQVYSIKI